MYEQGANPKGKKLEERRCMIKYMSEGQGFGELSILNNQPRSASVIAMEGGCHVYSVDKVVF